MAMLYRLLWHAGRYRIPDVLEMTVLECAIALGVDQTHKANVPYGQVREDTSASVEEAMFRASDVLIMDPAQLQGVLAFQVAQP